MSRSDSDSLDEEFESADEGGIKGEDIDLAELGLDSDEEQETSKKPADTTIHDKTSESNESNFEKDTSATEKINQTLKDETSEKPQNETQNEPKDTLKDFGCEDDDEVNKLLEEMNVNEPIVESETQKKSTQSTESQPKETKETSNVGWDDTELSDLDDDDLNVDPVKEEQIKAQLAQSQAAVVSSSKSVDAIRQIENEETKMKPSSSGWGWASSFLSTATFSVANVASQLGTGFNTVLETVEATIGAPDPVQLALAVKKSKEEQEGEDKEEIPRETNEKDFNDWSNDDQEWFTINSLASKGSQLVAGSLNVLETVGKKTFETLNERDPNLKKTRDLLNKVPKAIPTTEKPNLSQLLREAQQAREEQQNRSNTSDSPKRPLNNQVDKLTFGLFFDEYKGAANLEALEMLSQQAQVKNEANLGVLKKNPKLNSILKQLDELFQQENLNDDVEEVEEEDKNELFEFVSDFNKLVDSKTKVFDVDQFEMLISDYADELNLNLKLDKLVGAFQTSVLALNEMTDAQELFNESIKNFALITAKLVESFHKLAESILIDQQNKKKSLNSANIVHNVQYLFQITKLCIRSITLLAEDYSKKCRANSTESNAKKINQITTDIYLEASNSSTYVGDTFLLFNSIFKSQLSD